MKQQIGWTLAACIAVFASGASLAEGSATGTVRPLGSVQFSPDTDVKCLSSAIETGDPKAGHSTWVLKAPPGCVVPWHSHTAEEQLIIISGTVLAEMTDHPPTRLGPGGFASALSAPELGDGFGGACGSGVASVGTRSISARAKLVAGMYAGNVLAPG